MSIIKESNKHNKKAIVARDWSKNEAL